MAGTNRSPLVVVADAGPIIHLDELNALDVLKDYQRIVVPSSVWSEIQRHRFQALEQQAIQFDRQEPPRIPPVSMGQIPLHDLHLGERDALALCLDMRIDTLLTDDSAARLAASRLAIHHHGTLGLLIRAVRQQRRSPKQVLALLQAIPKESTLHLRPSLLAEVTEKLRCEWEI